MTIQRMIELLEIEHECMLRGSHNDCNRNCADCELVQDDGDLHEMYTDVIALLKEQEAIEKNKEYKIAVECLNAIQTVNKYIDDEEDECGCTYWKDKKGYSFQADIGYFFEGLDNFEEYLIKRLRQAVKRND